MLQVCADAEPPSAAANASTRRIRILHFPIEENDSETELVASQIGNWAPPVSGDRRYPATALATHRSIGWNRLGFTSRAPYTARAHRIVRTDANFDGVAEHSRQA